MTSWFYFLALGISLFFVLAIFVIFICAFIIYYQVEKSVVETNEAGERNE